MIIGNTTKIYKSLYEPLPVEKEKVSIDLEPKNSFFYIGKRIGKTKNCLNCFDVRYNAGDFEGAKYLLNNLHDSGTIPGLIIMDLPLNTKELSSFVLWLHSNIWSYMIPVIYNETILNEDELNQLRELNIADDIVNIEQYCKQLGNKANFLTQSKLKENRRMKRKKDNEDKREKTSIGKRIFDISIASVLLIITSPLMLLIALFIKLGSRGPVIYKSKRAGKGFKVFDFYKFRTMVQGADKIISEYSTENIYSHKQSQQGEAPMFFKLKNDPRITRFGKFLRNTSLDELPQLVNVLKGDMSIVGNRPLPLYEASSLTTNTNAERFSAPAGITGLWQVTKRGKENMDSEERVNLDIFYAKKQSFSLDVRILIQTPLALFQKSDV